MILFSALSTSCLDLTHHWVGYLSLIILALAYITAMLEEIIELRKSKPMLLGAGLMWLIIAVIYKQQGIPEIAVNAFKENLLAYTELFLFILVSMTYLNVMEDLKIFDVLRSWLVIKKLSYRQLFWFTGILSFVLAIFCSGLTVGLLMGAVAIAVGKEKPRFISLACINIVVATNAGGTFSAVGGISTLFVWQKGILGFIELLNLFIPSLVNFLVPAAIIHFSVPRGIPAIQANLKPMLRGAKRVLFLFAITIILAVGLNVFLKLPPAAGMMLGLSLLQFFSFYLQITANSELNTIPETHEKHLENKELTNEVSDPEMFDVFEKVGRLEWDTLLFFYGAMMGVGALSFIGYLDQVSLILYGHNDPTVANIIIGLSSAFIDNGTLMFAVLQMNPDLSQGQWLLATLTLGVGGSLLAIGSAPGVGLLGQAKGYYTFGKHLQWCPVILLGYALSVATHFAINAHYFK
jgi:Na+/H+ antiporter NhaD/arsenite permease-like protein